MHVFPLSTAATANILPSYIADTSDPSTSCLILLDPSISDFTEKVPVSGGEPLRLLVPDLRLHLHLDVISFPLAAWGEPLPLCSRFLHPSPDTVRLKNGTLSCIFDFSLSSDTSLNLSSYSYLSLSHLRRKTKWLTAQNQTELIHLPTHLADVSSVCILILQCSEISPVLLPTKTPVTLLPIALQAQVVITFRFKCCLRVK